MLKDRTKVTTNTTGTGTLALGSADSGFQDFSSISGQTYYAITNKDSWEVGVGTVSSGVLTRDQVYDSSSGLNRLNLTGKSTVFITYPANKAVYVSPSSNPSTGDLLFRGANSWDSRPLSSGDIVNALGASPLYSASGGVQLLDNNFSLGGTGYLDSLYTNRRMLIGRRPTSPNLDDFLLNGQPFTVVGDRPFLFTNYGLNINYASVFGVSCLGSTIGDFSYLTAVGYAVGTNSIDCANGIFIGKRVGQYSSGISNIFIGSSAGFLTRGTNNLEILTEKSTTSPNVNVYDNSYKLNIQGTIVGDSISKRLSIGNNDTSCLSPDATLQIIPSGTTSKGLLVKSNVLHTANLLEIDNSIGSNLFTVDPNGLASGVKFATSGGIQLDSGIPSSTSNSLYSSGTSLFWNGSRIVPNYSLKTASTSITYLSESDNIILLSGVRLALFFSFTASGSFGKIFHIKSLKDNALISPSTFVNPLPPYDSISDIIDGSSADIYTKKNECYSMTPTSSGWMILSKYSNYVDGNL